MEKPAADGDGGGRGGGKNGGRKEQGAGEVRVVG